uniref:Uncharacterized protein n=1 Tax=Mesocestoides corti TaxID=53468 RepID=A0A5K3FT46_MESCO
MHPMEKLFTINQYDTPTLKDKLTSTHAARRHLVQTGRICWQICVERRLLNSRLLFKTKRKLLLPTLHSDPRFFFQH